MIAAFFPKTFAPASFPKTVTAQPQFSGLGFFFAHFSDPRGQITT